MDGGQLVWRKERLPVEEDDAASVVGEEAGL